MNKINSLFTEFPKKGITLIEASAGTGKTFTIIKLYFTLLFNTFLKKKKYNYSIKNLLLLTFTKNSQLELKSRIFNYFKKIKKKYIQKKKILKNKTIEDTFNFFEKIEKNICDLEIYTIHSFFWKILIENQFICSNEIPKKILKNIHKLLLKSTKYFWRKIFYTLEKNVLYILLKKWKTPIILYKTIISFTKFQKNIYKIYPTREILTKQHNHFLKIIQNTKILWIKEKKKILPFLKNFKLNKRIYTLKNTINWINQITKWAFEKTKDYFLPKILKYFSNQKLKFKKKNKNLKNLLIFQNIENLLQTNFSLNEIFLKLSTIEIFFIFQKIKIKKNYIDFDDINKLILKNIKKKKSLLKKNIQKKYPIIFVDECQDIDMIQNKIFLFLYQKSKINSLILVGDPKQSIYSFRNADLKYYFFFQKIAKKKYFLNTNYRSSPNIVHAINELFGYKNFPFILKKLLYQNSKINMKNKHFSFFVKNVKQKSLKFFLCSQKQITKKEYFKISAKECAYSIANWILLKSQKKTTITFQKNKHINLLPKDIAVLVKNKNEAKIIKKELSKINIKSFYTSEKKNFFLKKITLEILWILEYILDIENENKFQKILLTKFFYENIYEIHQINLKIKKKIKIQKKIKKYSKIWKKNGIFEMFYNIYQNSKNIFKINYKEFIKIITILEKKDQTIKNKIFFVQWLKSKIQKNSEYSIDDQEISNFSKNYVQIITIFKSKGLEYPIVWIPFLNFYDQKINLFFKTNIKIQKKNIIIQNIHKNCKNLEKKNFSEELRLLYVALTRCQIHCCISLAFILHKKKKNNNSLNFLLKNRINKKKLFFKNYLQNTSKNIIQIYDTKTILKFKNITSFYKKKNIQKNFIKILLPWEILSYSKILKKQKKNIQNIHFFSKNNQKFNTKKKINVYTSYNFPSGKEYGKLLHKILKNINFFKISKNFQINLKKYSDLISKKKQNFLSKWIYNIIHCPILSHSFSLNQLKKNQYIQEMQFYIPIEKQFDVIKFNKIIKNFDFNSQILPEIEYSCITGMLTGFIDLICFWNNQYFIIDYKTNLLGPKNKDYNKKNIKIEIMKHRYDIQYQIYSLALHRYLKNNLQNYQFTIHFGGIIYLFLRAFDNIKNKNGIFFHQPKKILIEKLDLLFSGK
ncbi:exodeoxyribonuclease V subunit beta [Buchnera aphidicola]|uniref:exodeoxyribonuclease V subunit beta n=1 Tax=Buchnera aphidicola TaxID=9 RepID=UPI0031B835C8